MKRKKILFICGSINQTTQMHQIAQHLSEYDHYYTPFYGDGIIEKARQWGFLENTILGHKLANRCMSYLKLNDLKADVQGQNGDYDLVLTCSDLVMPKNILDSKVVLVQEGMTDPENFFFYLAKMFRWFPRWLASTSTTGLSHQYHRFCVASEGYRNLFIRKGVKPETLRVTGIPNFDNCKKYYNNTFPHKNFVLVCTSDSRETFKYENRKKFIEKCVKIADGRKLIFKLHPNENFERATREVNRYAPGALVYTSGNTEEMIANSDVLITRFSSTVYVGMALGKEVYSDFDIDELKMMTPVQNNSAARNIALVCRELLESESVETVTEIEHGVQILYPSRKSGHGSLTQSLFLKNS